MRIYAVLLVVWAFGAMWGWGFHAMRVESFQDPVEYVPIPCMGGGGPGWAPPMPQ